MSRINAIDVERHECLEITCTLDSRVRSGCLPPMEAKAVVRVGMAVDLALCHPSKVAFVI